MIFEEQLLNLLRIYFLNGKDKPFYSAHVEKMVEIVYNWQYSSKQCIFFAQRSENFQDISAGFGRIPCFAAKAML